MYRLDEIMDRAFDSWGNNLGANNNSFWTATSFIEAKPAIEAVDTVPEDVPVWEQAITNECCGGSCETETVSSEHIPSWENQQ